MGLIFNSYSFHFSLEQDSPELVSKVMPTSVGSLNSHPSCEDHQAGGEDCHLVVPMNGDDSETPERNCEGIPAETTGSLALNENNDNIDNLDHGGRNASSNGSLRNHSSSDKHTNNSAPANQPVDTSLNQANGMLSGLFESVTTGNHEVAGGQVARSDDLNKSTCTAVLSENGLHTTCGNFITVSNQPLGMSSAETGVKLSDVNSGEHENAIDINVSSSNGGNPAESGVICMYQCCPGCLHNLYHVAHKLLARELSNSHWTVEDVHDAVSSLSVDLISAVRKCHMAEDFSDSSKNTRHEKHGTSLNLKTCDLSNKGKGFVPVECVSHSTSQHATASKDEVPNESLELDLKFIFRDGVLVPVCLDKDKDVSLHCKCETLCLCSVRELIVATKRPFD